MEKRLNAEEVAVLIRGRKIIKEKGLSKDINVSGICDAAGISRKTGYEWEGKLLQPDEERFVFKREFDELKAKHADLLARHKEVRFENEGRKVAWEIHGVDAWLAGKKNTTDRPKKSGL